jgi:hypothetical protein
MGLLATIYTSVVCRCAIPRSGALVALLGLGLAPGATPAQEGRALEYEVKAAFLVKFALFVQWPTNASPPAAQPPLVVGILGTDPFGTTFDQSLSSAGLHGRSVQVRRAREAAELLGCQIVFISASEAGRFPELLAAFQPYPILTVADVPGFASHGGMIEFVKEAGKVRFEIKPDAIERAGLKASSKLLQVGRCLPPRAAPPS